MDYDLTIEKGRSGWVITVRAYHRVGSGCETTDLAWTCGGSNRLLEGYGGRYCMGQDNSEKERPTRKEAGVPRGGVRRRWMQDEAGYLESLA